jgi:hypothetical protein
MAILEGTMPMLEGIMPMLEGTMPMPLLQNTAGKRSPILRTHRFSESSVQSTGFIRNIVFSMAPIPALEARDNIHPAWGGPVSLAI